MRVSKAVVEELVDLYQYIYAKSYSPGLKRLAEEKFKTDPGHLSNKEFLACLEYLSYGYSEDTDCVKSWEDALFRWDEADDWRGDNE